MTVSGTACDMCLRRAWLQARLSAYIERVRARLFETLALTDAELIAAVAGRDRSAVERDWSSFQADQSRRRCADAGLTSICRCDPAYPVKLRALTSPPAVLHVRGDPAALTSAAVAIVGSRRPSEYGREVAAGVARGLSECGITVVSGMALGIDSAAHRGALDRAGALQGSGTTVAVLAAGADRPYPASQRSLHRRIAAAGAVISELPPGTAGRRWMFPARNRVIAALASVTVIVEATERSGSLVTAKVARELGRCVAAVPGRVSSPLAAGPNALLAGGASLVREARDVVELLGCSPLPEAARPAPAPGLRRLLDAIGAGADTTAALRGHGFGLTEVFEGVAALELSGHVRRAAGGRLVMAM